MALARQPSARKGWICPKLKTLVVIPGVGHCISDELIAELVKARTDPMPQGCPALHMRVCLEKLVFNGRDLISESVDEWKGA